MDDYEQSDIQAFDIAWGKGRCAARLSFCVIFSCSADLERDWPPYEVDLRVGNQYAECEPKGRLGGSHTTFPSMSLRPHAPICVVFWLCLPDRFSF